ncbi:MAG: hypothetical protein KME23_27775 [Goleter apudmare HA4340-LM2]|jgi:hypothetical protein|nr:hypothetical protein [Goleter apudmare HA4340-LM2]
MDKSFVYPKLPNAGLGNMLLVWAKAVLFAEINSLPIIAPSWRKLKIGHLLRGEKYQRNYGGYFYNKEYVSRIKGFIINWATTKIYEPPIQLLSNSHQLSHCVYIFSAIPDWHNYFLDIKENHLLIQKKLRAIIRPHLLNQIDACPTPKIGIHVRMSDFRKLQAGEDFAKIGSVRTPILWYVSVLRRIRELAGYVVPATIFSDGYDYELNDLLQLPKVIRAPHASAISDMLTLSRSKLIVTSAGSTFSAWASYLGQPPTIWHPAHFHSGVFSRDISKTTFEGGFDPEVMTTPDLLERNILSLFTNENSGADNL